MQIRKYNETDLKQMIDIWNDIVEEGIAFPQEELLDEQTGAAFFSSQSYCGVAVDDSNRVLGLYILHPNNVGRCGHICNASYITVYNPSDSLTKLIGVLAEAEGIFVWKPESIE